MNQKFDTTVTSHPEPAAPTESSLSANRFLSPFWLAALVAVGSAIWILGRMEAEPHFADESAMIAQSYYYTLFKSGQWHHPDWLHYAAYDHPPLPKYMFGLFLNLAGLPTPKSIAAWENWARGDFSPPRDPRVLYWARVPAAIFGIGGVLAVFFIGLQVHGRLVGLLAAFLLAVNPLYFTHARRAMSDSFAECLVISAVAAALWGARLLWASEFRLRQWALFELVQSVLCGLAVLAKLNGGIAIILVFSIFAMNYLAVHFVRHQRGAPITKPPLSPASGREVGGEGLGNLTDSRNLRMAPISVAAIAAGSLAIFVVLNPFLTSRPQLAANSPREQREIAAKGFVGRARFLVQFRREWSRDATRNEYFRKDWLLTISDRLRMTLWEGFGRFSALGPRNIRTIEPRPDKELFSDYRRAWSLIWFPLCLLGFGWTLADGWQAVRTDRMPQAWGLAMYATVTIGLMVLIMLPLNWDRYYLPMQACSAVLVPYGIVSSLNRLRSHPLPTAAGF